MQNTSGIVGLLFSYQGRINRGKYWLAVLIYVAISVVITGLGFIMLGNGILELADESADEGIIVGLLSKGIGFFLLVLVVYIPMIVSGIFVGIKRLHDRDKSGWWLLLFYLVPALLNELSNASFLFSLASFAISIWAFVELGCLRGTAGPNKYGPDPLAS
jgi:uncharacterized membrane protein YhaH (DUF805 family)